MWLVQFLQNLFCLGEKLVQVVISVGVKSSACTDSLPSEQGITNSTSLVALRLLLHCRGEHGTEGVFPLAVVLRIVIPLS